MRQCCLATLLQNDGHRTSGRPVPLVPASDSESRDGTDLLQLQSGTGKPTEPLRVGLQSHPLSWMAVLGVGGQDRASRRADKRFPLFHCRSFGCVEEGARGSFADEANGRATQRARHNPLSGANSQMLQQLLHP